MHTLNCWPELQGFAGAVENGLQNLQAIEAQHIGQEGSSLCLTVPD